MYIAWDLIQRKSLKNVKWHDDGNEDSGSDGSDDNNVGSFRHIYFKIPGKTKSTTDQQAYCVVIWVPHLVTSTCKSVSEGKDANIMWILLFMVIPWKYQESVAETPDFFSTCKIVIWKVEMLSDDLIKVELLSSVERLKV